MKRIFIILSFLIPTFANALVADRFKCDFEIKDVSGKKAVKSEEFFVARLPLSASPSPNVRLTSGVADSRMVLDLNSESFVANLTFNYQHAVKLDSSGEATDGRQVVCMTLTASYCDKSTDPSFCSEGKSSCMTTNPYDPHRGWSETPIADGIPRFAPDGLGEVESIIYGSDGSQIKGSARFNCQYKGTFY